MLKVGLTGSIAVGKSYVCKLLAQDGFEVLDADQTAREVVKKGAKGLEKVVEAFGESVLTKSGELDRKELGKIVFSDDEKRQLLNSILHPLIISEQDVWMRKLKKEKPSSICVVEAALMIESGSYKRFDEIVVVWCDQDVQISRLMKRDGISRRDAVQKISAQMAQDEKKTYASVLIDTSGGYDDTVQNTESAIRYLRRRRVV